MVKPDLIPHNDNTECPIIESLLFKRNYNSKLYCDCFTSIRSKRIEVGEYRHVILAEEGKEPLNMGTVVVLEVVERKFEALNDWVCYLDTGSCANITRLLLQSFYQGDLTGTSFFIHLFKFQEPLANDSVL